MNIEIDYKKKYIKYKTKYLKDRSILKGGNPGEQAENPVQPTKSTIPQPQEGMISIAQLQQHMLQPLQQNQQPLAIEQPQQRILPAIIAVQQPLNQQQHLFLLS